MTALKIREREYTFDNQNQVIGEKPDMLLALSQVQSVSRHRNGAVIFNTKQGPVFYANRPLSMIFGEVQTQQGVSEILAEMPVYDEYFYKTRNGQKARAFDKRSVASFLPLSK